MSFIEFPATRVYALQPCGLQFQATFLEGASCHSVDSRPQAFEWTTVHSSASNLQQDREELKSHNSL